MAVDLKAEEITEIIRQQLTGISKGVDVASIEIRASARGLTSAVVRQPE